MRGRLTDARMDQDAYVKRARAVRGPGRCGATRRLTAKLASVGLVAFVAFAAKGETLIRSRYVNCTYRFRIDLPAGLVGHADDPPAPNHGFGIDLGDPRATRGARRTAKLDRYLYVDATYNTLEEPSADAVVQHRAREFRRLHPEARISTRAVTIGGLEAVSYRGTSEGRVDEAVVALREGIVFTVAMTTTSLKHEADGRLFGEVLRGADFTPRGIQGKCGSGRKPSPSVRSSAKDE